jgi:hypothetical protein
MISATASYMVREELLAGEGGEEAGTCSHGTYSQRLPLQLSLAFHCALLLVSLVGCADEGHM